jgi:hypothetical protein
MVQYTCDNCNKEFNRISNYNTHINRKNKCKKPQPKPEDFEKLKLENKLLRQDFEELKKTINDILKEKINNNTTINHIINANTNNIQQTANIQNNNTIKLNPYRKEDLSHITDQEYNRLLSLGYGSVPSFVKKIHFNDDKPENHNILLTRADCNDIYVYNNENEWECKDKNIVIEQIISDKTNILYNKRLDKDDTKSYKFDNYFASFESEDKKKMKDVTESVKRVCLTGKDKVMKIKKLISKKKLEN